MNITIDNTIFWGSPLFLGLILQFATRRWPISITAALLMLLIGLPLRFGFTTSVLISLAAIIILGALTIRRAQTRQLFKFAPDADIRLWRIIARPLAFLFIPMHYFWGKTSLLLIMGLVALVFIALDLYRLFARVEIRPIFKHRERHRFSSMTAFLVALFIVFLLFPTHFAYLCLGFITIGDMFGKFVGLKFGKLKLIQDRTLEGSLGFLCGCYLAGYTLHLIFDISLIYVVIGSFSAALVELFSWDIDDNFTVSIITGCILAALRYFLF